MKHDLRVLVDVSTDKINNNGDMAMFAVLLKRFRDRYPSARIKMITDDPEGVAQLDSSVEPVVVGSRDHLALHTTLGLSREATSLPALYQLETQLKRTRPYEYLEIISRSDANAAEGYRNWIEGIEGADVVVLTGGGYFTDVFAQHAVHLLSTLDEAVNRGLPTFISGCGFEPVCDKALLNMAENVLPRVTGVAVREASTSPQVLAQFGVKPEKIAVTGDDAIALSYAARPAELGPGLGINLRNSTYNRVPEGSLEIVRNVVQKFAREFGAPLLPAPISNYGPSDAEVIRQLLSGFDDLSDGGATLNTPETLLAQIAQCRVMVTGSYHAAVFAMSMGIPAICLTASSHYQLKMRGLQAMFHLDAGDRVLALDAPELEDWLTRVLREAWGNAQELRPHLLQMAERQIELGQAAYDAMFDMIDRFVPEPKPMDQSASRIELCEKTVCELLRDLVSAQCEMRAQRDYLQYHCDERLRVIDNLLIERNKERTEKAEKTDCHSPGSSPDGGETL